MSERDVREAILRHKLKMLASAFGVDIGAFLAEAERLNLFRDARESAGEVHIHLHGLPSVAELERTVTDDEIVEQLLDSCRESAVVLGHMIADLRSADSK